MIGENDLPEGNKTPKSGTPKGGTPKAASPKTSPKASPKGGSPKYQKGTGSPGSAASVDKSPEAQASSDVPQDADYSPKKPGSDIPPDGSATPKNREPDSDASSKGKGCKETANDALNAEFVYYSAVLRCFAPTLTKEHDKINTHLWMRKLFKPEYHSTILKPKRNKYLLYLTITMYNDEAFGIFKQEPPSGVLPEVGNIKLEADLPPAAWELDKQWLETIQDLPDEIKQSDCYLHSEEGNSCPETSQELKSVFDAEFQFYLWLVKPYVALMADPEDKTMIACWIQLLCGIAPQENDCAEMKELRNDYMQALIGYVHDLRVEGPFRLMPPAGPLPPLSYLLENYEGEEDLKTPTGKEAEEFLAMQPLPDNGAFAYINVTGELFGHIS